MANVHQPATLTGVCLGAEYRFSVRSVSSPMAFRARAIMLNSGVGISGFGNTREAAVRSMQDRVRNYVEDCIARGWAR